MLMLGIFFLTFIDDQCHCRNSLLVPAVLTPVRFSLFFLPVHKSFQINFPFHTIITTTCHSLSVRLAVFPVMLYRLPIWLLIGL